MNCIQTPFNQHSSNLGLLDFKSEITATFEQSGICRQEPKEFRYRLSLLDRAELESLNSHITKIANKQIRAFAYEKLKARAQIGVWVITLLTCASFSALILFGGLSSESLLCFMLSPATALIFLKIYDRVNFNITMLNIGICAFNIEHESVQTSKTQYRTAISEAIKELDTHDDRSASPSGAPSISSNRIDLRSHKIEDCDEELIEDVEANQSNESPSHDQSFASCSSMAHSFDFENVYDV